MLFLVIDAIPFDVAHELWSLGGMPDFLEPRPMVSVFPSLTNVAVPMLLRCAFDSRPPGYEPRWYDPSAGEVKGGLSDPESEAALAPFRTGPRGNLGHIAVYTLSAGVARGAARVVGRRFRREGGPWLGYIAATDGVMHFQGRAALLATLTDIVARVTETLDDYRREHGVRPGAVLTSDHGAWFGELAHLDVTTVEAALRAAGLPVGPGGVVLAPMGDVGAGAAWCPPALALATAEVIAALPAVDVVFAARGDGADVFGARGSARIAWSVGRTRYDPGSGDPLGYGDLPGWIDDEPLFQATWDRPYPYAPARVRGAFTELVHHPAQVLFSMADGWTYGATLTHAAARLRGGQRGTHGGLGRAQTLGFAAATLDHPIQGPLRPEQVFAPWAELVAAGAAPEVGGHG